MCIQEEQAHAGITCANSLISACAEAGDMAAAADVLEATVAAGAVPQSGTIAALLGGCQRAGAHELAFQVRPPPPGYLADVCLSLIPRGIPCLGSTPHRQARHDC